VVRFHDVVAVHVTRDAIHRLARGFGAKLELFHSITDSVLADAYAYSNGALRKDRVAIVAGVVVGFVALIVAIRKIAG